MHFSLYRSRSVFVALGAASVVLLGSLACASAPDLTTRLASGDRSAEDKARDLGRKPGAVLTFLGVEKGMTVVDLLAAGGYYTEVLSEAVGPEGHVYTHNTEFLLKMREGVNEKAITARLAGNRLPNVERLDREMSDLGLESGSVDVFFTALNFHDIYNSAGPEQTQAVLLIIHDLLKADGFLAVIDHYGNAGDDNTINAKLHRIDEALALAALHEAGFVVEASSDVLRNPDDDRTQQVFAEGLRGMTDRFVLKLRKAP